MVRVSREKAGVSRDLTTLKAGEFSGETARNATVTSIKPCTLYRLHREYLRVTMDTRPAIRRVLEQESRRRASAAQEVD